MIVANHTQEVICHELQKFYGHNEEVKIRCKTSGSPSTGLTDVISKKQTDPKKEQVLFLSLVGDKVIFYF